MGLIGGNSRNTTTSTQYDKPVTVQDTPGQVLVADGSTIDILDGGAIAAMERMAADTVARAADLTLSLLDRQAQANTAAYDALRAGQDQAYQFAYKAGAPEAQTISDGMRNILIVGGILALGIAIKAFKS